ncbi:MULTISPECIES: GNAT family N-acetyltransferase [unclassified Streptomyces]|uniref:GNAT family N-acetyltransferase n=1 Tax=unclassified Streptomyces TaxID=2593676 RepID=UPI003247432A
MIETPRLLLRRFAPTDASALQSYRNDPEIARYQAWPSPLSDDAAADTAFIYSLQETGQPGWVQTAVVRKQDGALIGDVGVELHQNLLQAELSFALAPQWHRQGYATEMVTAVINHHFQRGVHRFSASCDARNIRSAHLLERVGFRREGLRPEHTRNINTGEWTDTVVFGLLARHWVSRDGKGPLTAGNDGTADVPPAEAS